MALLAFIVLMAGFIWFLNLLPESTATKNHVTIENTAAVVFTGASQRLKTGLDLLRSKKIQQLFISGVYHGNHVRDILEFKQDEQDLANAVILGYDATNTQGNAIETFEWLKKQPHIRALYVITNDYHMPRSLLQLGYLVRDVRIIPYAIQAHAFDIGNWDKNIQYWRLLFSEYLKYMVALIFM